jgi:galactokinase/galacturonokinase
MSNMTATEAFEKTYRKAPPYTAFTPYRVCPIGAHSDHQLGKITGMAIDKGIHVAYGPKQNGVVEIRSLQFPKRAQWHVAATPDVKQNDWADHLRGATIALHSRYPLRTGLCAVIDGELPIGGLSSSAAVIITFLTALCNLNSITLTPPEMIEIAKEAENRLKNVNKNITVAIMGCVVNGPGEASAADIGIAGGKGCGVLFKKGEIIAKLQENELVDRLVEEIEKM